MWPIALMVWTLVIGAIFYLTAAGARHEVFEVDPDFGKCLYRSAARQLLFRLPAVRATVLFLRSAPKNLVGTIYVLRGLYVVFVGRVSVFALMNCYDVLS